MVKISLKQGDITKLAGEFDAIVNAAKNSLLGGGGVDGCIHKAAGPELLEECKTLGGCATGEAKMTKAYDLPCKAIIHTVGPVYFDEKAEECDVLLTLAYLNSIEVAVKNGIKKIAFPSISTGIYGFPIDRAVKVISQMLEAVNDIYKKNDLELTWVLYTEEDYEAYQKLIA